MTAIHGTTEIITGNREDLFSPEVRLLLLLLLLLCSLLWLMLLLMLLLFHRCGTSCVRWSAGCVV